MSICPGCKIEYPTRLLDRIVGVTKSYICPLCALYILRDIHGKDVVFHGEQNIRNYEEAFKIGGLAWTPPTEVE